MTKTYFKDRLGERWPVWAAITLRLMSRLVRTKTVGVEQTTKGPCGIAHWHGDELALIPRFGHIGPTILVSHSKDGAIMAKGTTALGYGVTRGSSTSHLTAMSCFAFMRFFEERMPSECFWGSLSSGFCKDWPSPWGSF